jgi:tetratricopeptide (TPR) repeat protein
MQLKSTGFFSGRWHQPVTIYFLFILGTAAGAQDWITEGIRQIIHVNFDQAIALYQNEIDARPEDYRAHFYLAAALSSRMIHFENNEGQDRFERAINSTIELIQNQLRTETDLQPAELGQYYFYLGSAYGYRAYNQGRSGKWLAAWSNGNTATDYLQQAVDQDSTLYDAYLGIGTFQYWRTSKLSFILWLPFVADQREEGIRKIKRTAATNSLSRDLAGHQLVYILLDYGRNEEAVLVARDLAEKYPRSQFMCWALAHAYFKSTRYPEAEEAYLHLVGLINDDPHKNLNHLLNCKFKLALIYQALNDESRCREQCISILELYDGYPEKEKFEKIDKVKKLLKQVQEKQE